MRCKTARELISARIDGDLLKKDAGRLRKHIAGCERCAALERDLIELKRLAGELDTYQPPADLFDQVMATLDESPDARTVDAAQGGVRPSSTWVQPNSPLSERRWSWAAVGWATAAAGALGLFFVFSGDLLIPQDTPSFSSGNLAVGTGAGTWGTGAGRPLADGVRVADGVRATGLGALSKTAATKDLFPSSRGAYDAVEREYRGLIDQLRAIVNEQSHRWSMAERQRYERDMKILENAINKGRAAVQWARVDPHAQDLLYDLYRQQLRYLKSHLFRDSGEARVAWEDHGGVSRSHVMPASMLAP